MFDMDNDGYNDIYVCNGVNKDVTNLDFMEFFANDVLQKMVLSGKKEASDEILKHVPVHPMLHKAYRNNGNLGFSDEGLNWGFTQSSFANGAAYADLDNDGAMDLIINNENGPAFIYRNNSRELNKNNYIALQLKGKGDNTFAIGSKIRVYAGKTNFLPGTCSQPRFPVFRGLQTNHRSWKINRRGFYDHYLARRQHQQI